MRMKRLGLGETVANVQVSEAAALEQVYFYNFNIDNNFRPLILYNK